MDVLFSTVNNGLLGAGVLLLPTLAVALLYSHGRYLPIWLPDLGLLGAYVIHAAWHRGIGPLWAVPMALAVTAVLGSGVHRFIMAPFIEANEPLRCLLVGIGLSVIFQSAVSMYGKGMSQHYPANPLGVQSFSPRLGISIHRADVACLLVVLAALVSTAIFLGKTRWGLKIKAVIANRDLARHFMLPVHRVDMTIVSVASAFVLLGTLFRGIRYDLQPQMMFFPGLFAIAACVAAGPGRLYAPLAVAVLLEIVAGLVGTVPALSPLRRAVPFAVLIVVLLARAAANRHTTIRSES